MAILIIFSFDNNILVVYVVMCIKAFNQLGSVQQCIVLSTQHIGFF